MDLSSEYSSGLFYLPITVTINGVTQTVSALVDTGASFTCIDERFVPPGTIKESDAPVFGVNDGDKQPQDVLRPQYRADIQIGPHQFTNVLFTSTIHSHEAIIGMNILRHLKVFMNNGTLSIFNK